MPIEEKLLKKRWYFQGFNGTLALLFGAAKSAPVNMPARLGYGYSGLILYFEDDKCYFLYAWDDMQKIHDELVKKVRIEKNYLEYLEREDKLACKETMGVFNKVVNLTNLSDDKLKQIYAKTQEACANLLSVSHIVEGWVHITEEKIRKKVEDPKKLEILTTPSFDGFLTKEQIELQKIAEYAKTISDLNNDDKLTTLLEKHAKKYYWINNSYSSSKILEKKYFLEELKRILKINRPDLDPKKLRAKKNDILSSSDDELKELIKINDVIFKIHDRRKEHLTKSVIYLDKILFEFNRRTKIEIELLRYLLPEDGSVDKEELALRRNKCIYFIDNAGFKIYSGKKAQEYIQILEKQIKVKKTSIIKGNSASLGKATGIVKVCRGELELVKVKKGDILVACMTQPEFVPAMKRASAIITDEGGLTCHAAIVCRELKIPCIIGTKIATKILKDGDKVQVDADNGFVKII